jgi:hypothetical protein
MGQSSSMARRRTCVMLHDGAAMGVGEGREEARRRRDVGSLGAGTEACGTSWVASAVGLEEAAWIGRPARVAGAACARAVI